jgi:RHS repeat-associated protein
VGYYYDSDFQQYHLRQRYFLPSTGRFVSVDPLLNGNVYGYLDNDLLNPGLLSNGYCYVGNNPVNGLDPSGLLVGPWELVLIIFTDVAGTVLVTVVIPVIIVVGVGTLIRMLIRYSICSAKFRKCMSRALNKAKDCTEQAVLAARGPIDGTKCATYHKRKFEIGCLGAYSLCLASWFGAFVDPSFECEKCDFPKEDDFDDCETSTIDDCIWNVCRYNGRASGCEVVPPFPPLAPRARCACSAEVHPQR